MLSRQRLENVLLESKNSSLLYLEKTCYIEPLIQSW